MIDILLVTWERPEITEKVIRTINRNTDKGTYRLVVLDNGSKSEGMADMLSGLLEEELIDNLFFGAMNRGLEPARNQLLSMSETEYIVTTDSDCLPMPKDKDGDWLSKLKKLLDDNPEYAAISCRTQVMIGTGNIYEEHEDEDIVEFGHPGGSLRIMRSEAVRETGGWRDEVSGRGTEERYICGKLHEAGFKTGFAVKVNCYHMFGDRSRNTDRWGYPADWLPSDTGHSDIWHPSLENGDDEDEVKKYAQD